MTESQPIGSLFSGVRCRCGKWQTYLGHYDKDGYTIRCRGCLRAFWRCSC